MNWRSDRQMAAKGVVSIADQVLVSGGSFLTTIVVARLGGEIELGLFALLMAGVLVAAVVQQTLVTTPYTTLVHQMRPGERRRYAGAAVLQSLGLVASIAVPVLIGGILCALLLPSQFVAALLFALAIATIGWLLRDLVRRLLQAHLCVGRMLAFDAVVVAAQLAALGYLAWQSNVTASNVLAYTGAAVGLTAVMGLLAIRGMIRLHWSSVRDYTRQNWEFGRWILGYELAGTTRSHGMHWLLAAGASVAATGGFAACLSLVRVVNPIFLGIVGVTEPRMAGGFAAGGLDELRRITLKVSLLLAAMMGIVCVVVAAAGAAGLSLLFGSTFAQFAPALTLLTLGMAVSVISYPAACAVRTVGRPELNFAVRMASLVVALCVAAVMIPTSGVWGAACGALTGSVTAAIGRWHALARVLYAQPAAQEARP